MSILTWTLTKVVTNPYQWLVTRHCQTLLPVRIESLKSQDSKVVWTVEKIKKSKICRTNWAQRRKSLHSQLLKTNSRPRDSISKRERWHKNLLPRKDEWNQRETKWCSKQQMMRRKSFRWRITNWSWVRNDTESTIYPWRRKTNSSNKR